MSLVVHSLLSEQGAVFGVKTHPPGVAGLQMSSVQKFPSSQLGAGPPTQAPAAQVSLVVHSLLSEHGAVLGVKTQPPGVAGLQVSLVQTLPSLQTGAGPPTQA